MAMTAADILVERMISWGIDVVFGIPGDGINGVMEALRTRQDRIRFITVRHEESAALMATGYAKYTGKLGCCLGTSGPGGLHLLNGLYDAKLDGAPVLAITGHHYHDLIDTHAQQDVDLDRVFEDCCVYNTRVMGTAHVQNVIELACRRALAYHGVSHINFPVDFQTEACSLRSERNLPRPAMPICTQARVPAEEDLQRAADVLNAGRRVAILAGRGALKATDELIAVADKLGAPIVKALLGKACVPDDSPYTTGTLGLLGTKPSEDVMEGCDTLFMIGTAFPYMEFLPKPGQARCVQLDADPARIGLRYPVEAGLVGDARATLQQLLPRLHQNQDRRFLEMAQQGMLDWMDVMAERATRRDVPMKPQVVAYELGRRLSDNAILSCDSGTITTWWARHILAKRGQMHSVSGTLATMACGLPYAIAAAIAYPDRPSIAFVGDGGFAMLMAEFATAVQYRLPIKVIVIRNDTLGQIKWEQMVMLGNPEYGCDLQPIDFALFAQACGGSGFTAEDPETCGNIIEQALATPGPVLVDAIVDPLEPPLPAKITAKQAAQFARSLVRGQREGGKIISTVIKNKVREMV